jgi:hypothetical protein
MNEIVTIPVHPYPVAAWIAMASGMPSPDQRIQITRIVQIPDRFILTLDYTLNIPVEGILLAGFGSGDCSWMRSDFYCGPTPPSIRRVHLTPNDPSTRVSVEWLMTMPSVVYHSSTQSLYVCAPCGA